MYLRLRHLTRTLDEHPAAPGQVAAALLDRGLLPDACTPLARARITPVLDTVARAWQRTTRGWGHADTWSLDTHLCATLGAQLTHLAGHTHTYPTTGHTYATWTAELAAHGTTLAGYDPDDPDTVTAAQQSLRWVADHLPDLWD